MIIKVILNRRMFQYVSYFVHASYCTHYQRNAHQLLIFTDLHIILAVAVDGKITTMIAYCTHILFEKCLTV